VWPSCWRAVGGQAFCCFGVSDAWEGCGVSDFDERLARDFQSIFGLSESAAEVAAAGRDGVSAASGFDRVTGMSSPRSV
jgi:hypothetical protein